MNDAESIHTMSALIALTGRQVMTTSLTIDELSIPLSLDAPDAREFVIANDLRIAVLLHARGSAADPDTPTEKLAYMHEQQAERKQWHVARQNGQMVAYAATYWSNDHATRVTWLEVGVLPARQGQGIGTALFNWMETLAQSAGRPVVQGNAFHLPTAGPLLESPNGFGTIPRESRNAQFLLGRGYTLEQVYRHSALNLPVHPPILERILSAAVAKAGTDYRISTWIGPTPAQWQDDLAVIFTRMATDAPAGNLEIDEEPWNAELVRESDERRVKARRTALVAVAEHIPSGRLVAYNGLTVPEDRSRPVRQGITLVLKEHRGHRLGMLTKIANIQQLQAFSPESRVILTANAEENRPMLRVNEAIGFVPIAAEGAWKKILV